MTSALAALHFLRPHWLWALLALPLLAAWWRARRRRDHAWRGTVDAHLLPALLDVGGGRRGRINAEVWMLPVAFALGVLALAGPSWRQDRQPLLQTEAPLVIAWDLSSTALADDLPPSRLLQARANISALLAKRAGGQVGLVAYADDAYTVAPLTDDAGNVALFLDALSPDVMPGDGSRSDRAIAWSAKLLKQAGFAGGEILLLTDHADADARAAAAQARRDGVRVSVLGLGTAAGTAFRTPFGEIAHTRLDAASLQSLAAAGGGDYAALTVDSGDLERLGVLDGARLRDGVAAHGGEANVWRDEGYWLLLPLLLLVALAFRRGSALAAIALVSVLPSQGVRAADGGTLWRRADQVQQAQMQDGADAYRKQDYAAAERAWTSLPGADAAYNRGNALAKAGRYEDALAAYDDALRQRPGMQDAIDNRRAVTAAMKRSPPPAPSKGRGQQKQSQGGKPQDGQSQPSQHGAQSQQDQNGTPPPKPSTQPPGDPSSTGSRSRQPQTPPPSGNPANADAQRNPQQARPPDAAQQRQADAEQRARMQQALQRAREREPRDADGGAQARERRTETAAQRERRQANEAWLRRVPDAPGDLLRAKFQLEYERRQESGDR
jgi:Ca-activated chloride channel family protein